LETAKFLDPEEKLPASSSSEKVGWVGISISIGAGFVAFFVGDAVRSEFMRLQTLRCITMFFVTSSSSPMKFPPNNILGRASHAVEE
jgi:hypothetical protein